MCNAHQIIDKKRDFRQSGVKERNSLKVGDLNGKKYRQVEKISHHVALEIMNLYLYSKSNDQNPILDWRETPCISDLVNRFFPQFLIKNLFVVV